MKRKTLHQHAEEYLTMRSALGYRVYSDQSLLRGFSSFAEQQGSPDPISAELVLSWVCRSPAVGAATRANRLSKLRGFLRYLRAFYPETEVPEQGLIANGRRPSPYIYSEEELAKLLAATQLITVRGFARRSSRSKPLRPYTYETLIGLLASTGLRVGEAIRLDIDDFRLRDDPPNLLVRQTKFRKDRVVPLHPSVAEMLHRYLHLRRELGYHDGTSAFFVSERGRRLKHRTISITWGILLRRAGIGPTADGRRPTVHALRHTFAVRRLVTWQQQRVNVTAMVPHLSVYMGHSSPENTYWYLTATPELLSLAAETFQLFTGGGDIR